MKTAFSELKKSPVAEHYKIKRIAPQMFEVWLSPFVYVCMLTRVEDGRWGATHNMYPAEGSTLFDTPLEAVEWYRQLR